MLGLALAAVAAVIDVTVRVAYSGQVLPGTALDGLDVGGVSEFELRRRVRGLDVAGRTVTFVHQGRRLPISARSAGFRLDEERTARRAMRAGRDGPLAGLGATMAGLLLGRTVSPAVAVDQVQLRRTVTELARRVDEAPFVGALEIDSSTRAVSVVPPRPGQRVDKDATVAAIRAAFSREGEPSVALPVVPEPGVSRAAVEAVADQARSFLERPLRVTGIGRPYEVPQRWTSGALTVEREGAAARLALGHEALDALVVRVARQRDQPARDARIRPAAGPDQLSEPGDVDWRPRSADIAVTPARSGRSLDRDATAEAIADTVREGRNVAEATAQPLQPLVTTAAARRVDAQLGTFTTFFACCEPRVTNIRRIAAAVNGTVIAPDEAFSLNAVAGPRTREKGYLPAPFIADGEIVPSVGGGVSQFSTTIYNAAYFAGLQLDTHQPHSFFIDRYPPGREATLDYDSIDLIWTNDTSAPVLVDASSTPTSVSVSLYGQDEGRRVLAVSGARQTVAGGDFSVTVTRVIRYPDGRVAREPFTTTYDLPPDPA
ncbi:MAG: VanW family protein [Solirubrobacteraceae bacterium]